MKELKPCPFCGKTGRILVAQEFGVCVKCVGCGVQTPWLDDAPDGLIAEWQKCIEENAIEKSINKWNQRAYNEHDFIRRDDVINALEDEILKAFDDSPYCYDYWSYIKEIINGIPSAEPKQKTGKWERWVSNEDQTNSLWRCTSCGIVVADRKCLLWKYCPECGAKMEVDLERT